MANNDNNDASIEPISLDRRGSIEDGEEDVVLMNRSRGASLSSISYHQHDDDHHPPPQLSSSDSCFSVCDIVDLGGFGRFQYMMLFLCGGMLFAESMEVMLLSFIIPVLEEDWNLTSVEAACIGAVVFLGMFTGAYLLGSMSDKLGRRNGYLASVIVMLVGGLLTVVSPSYYFFVVCRFFVGIGAGGAPVGMSLFSEFLPTRERGKMLMLVELFWTFGVVVESGLAWVVLTYQSWRYLLLYSTFPMFVLLLFFSQLPESPHYYQICGRTEEAKQVLIRVVETNNRAEQLPTIWMLEQSSNTMKRGALSQLFSKDLIHITSVIWVIWFTDTAVYYGIAFLAPRYFAETSLNVYMIVFVLSLSEIPGNVVPGFFLVDRFGRRRTVQVMLAISGVSCLVLLGFPDNLAPQLVIMFIARMCITAAFNCTYIYTPELYPSYVRATGLGAASSVSRVAGAITSFVVEGLPSQTSLIAYGVVSLGAAMFIVLLQLETSGVPLSDVAPPKSATRQYDVMYDEKSRIDPSGGERSAAIR